MRRRDAFELFLMFLAGAAITLMFFVVAAVSQ